jgi:N-acetyl sugar amidotransferase
MDTTDTKIIFDQNGVCDHCNGFYKDIKPYWHPDKQSRVALEKIVQKIKKDGTGKEFDCLIGMSGGIDSSYLTYVAKEQLGLRPLVFHVDTGWDLPFAIDNITRITGKLGLQLHTAVIPWEEMKDLQIAYFKSGVPTIDTPQDHAIFATMYQFASKYKIKYILTGANYSTECIRNPIEWMYYQSDARQLKDIHKKFGTIPLKKFPTTNILWHKIYLPYIRGIKVEKPLNCIPYIKNDAVTTLVNRFGYQPYAQKHFECVFTKFYESYWLYEKFGYDTRKVQFSSLILTDQMTREEALEILKTPPYDEKTIQQDFQFIASKLQITTEELQIYMNAPNKTYKDYKSNENIYTMGAKIMRGLKMEKGGKR